MGGLSGCCLTSALVLALVPVSLSGQASTAARDDVVWHWFGDCASSDSLVLEVTLDGKTIYSSAFPICQRRRSAIKPEPQQRILEFRFDGVPRRFGAQYRATGTEPLEGNIWERRGERHALVLGVSFATDQRVLLNTVHIARADSPSRSERVRGLVILTRPARRSERTPPHKRSKLPGGDRSKGSGVLCAQTLLFDDGCAGERVARSSSAIR